MAARRFSRKLGIDGNITLLGQFGAQLLERLICRYQFHARLIRQPLGFVAWKHLDKLAEALCSGEKSRFAVNEDIQNA